MCESAAWRAATGTLSSFTRQATVQHSRISNLNRPLGAPPEFETFATTVQTVHETVITSRWVNVAPKTSVHDKTPCCWVPAHLHERGETMFSLYPRA